jgi:hypothetical protein
MPETGLAKVAIETAPLTRCGHRVCIAAIETKSICGVRVILVRNRTPGLFPLDARRLDDRPPLLNLGLLESAQRLGSLLFAWRNTLSEIRESLAHHSPI